MSKFFDTNTNTKHSKTIDTDSVSTKFTADCNWDSMFGTIWSVSTSAISGITESVITPGFRTIKFVIGIIQIKKRLDFNINVITSKIKKITSTLSAISGNGEYNHVRKTVIKRKVNVRK